MPICFFFNDTATTEIYTLSLHDALPISDHQVLDREARLEVDRRRRAQAGTRCAFVTRSRDRKSTRLNSSHANISYAVFCLKKKRQSIPLNLSHTYSSYVDICFH